MARPLGDGPDAVSMLGDLFVDPRAHGSAAVLVVLASLRPEDGLARVCLPAPHPAVRPLLAVSWRVAEFDLFMATEPWLLDPRRAVPSAAMA